MAWSPSSKARVCKTLMRGFDSHPGLTARVAELVYAHDLKSCPARDVGSIPTSGTVAGVAELVYALVLGTSVERLEGSSPSSSTERKQTALLS